MDESAERHKVVGWTRVQRDTRWLGGRECRETQGGWVNECAERQRWLGERVCRETTVGGWTSVQRAEETTVGGWTSVQNPRLRPYESKTTPVWIQDYASHLEPLTHLPLHIPHIHP
jgi:hypothetical protein